MYNSHWLLQKAKASKEDVSLPIHETDEIESEFLSGGNSSEYKTKEKEKYFLEKDPEYANLIFR